MKLSNIFLFRVFLIMGVLMVQNNKAIASSWIESQTAELQLLDKITARISTKSVPVGGGTEFGTLELRVHYCAYRPPEEPPENVAFIMIFDNGYAEKKPKAAQKAQKAQKALFSGWMFASSPAISGLEHPVYDVTLLSCHKD
jgi:hypothetical protein|tara:strand:- start:663 stop:1088 length:426 start_codon:yes stop_codon:yes gene_type:complete